MHIDTHEVWRHEHSIDLTATEFNLLRHLLENARRVISKSELIDNVWGYGFSGRPQHRRDLHQLPAQEDRRGRARAHPHHPTSGLHPPVAQRRVSLQRRLVAVMSILLVVGLLVADVVTYVSVRSFLYGRADDTLASSEALAFNYVAYATDAHRRRCRQADLSRHVSPDVYVLIINHTGKVVISRPSGSPARPDPAPLAVRLDPGAAGARHRRAHVRPLRRHLPPQSRTRWSSGAGATRTGAYRAVAVERAPGHHVRGPLAQPHQRHAGLAAPGRGAGQPRRPRHHGGARPVAVRRDLRPLREMAETADAIASGDLGRRVPEETPTTEVGRLGTALNEMLTQIEEAFAEKSASEERLRQFVADASHELRTPSDLHQGLRRAAAPGRVLRRGRHPQGAAAGRGGGDPHGGPGRGPPPPGRAGSGPAAADRNRSISTASAPTSSTTATPSITRTSWTMAPGREVVVLGDAERLTQVAHNLVRNALAHTPPGSLGHGVHRRPRGAWASSGSPTTGPGIDPALAAARLRPLLRGAIPGRTGLGHRAGAGHRARHRRGPRVARPR